MDAGRQSDLAAGRASTTVERVSERELAVTRAVNGPARLVFEAWAKPELFQRWWAPRSFGVFLVSYEADVRTGGAYRLVMGHSSLGAAHGVLRSLHRRDAPLPHHLDQ